MKNQILKGSFFIIFIISFFTGGCIQETDKNCACVFGDSTYLANVPDQPGEDTWKFIEDLFLNELASIYWKKEDVLKVVQAWKLFSEGYQNYPLVNLFQYYGPMHDGPVWPLLLKPADAPLSPTWQIGSASTKNPWPPSGDRIGECLGEVLTLEEVAELTRRMTISWEKGSAILTGLKKNYANEPERLSDIRVAQALGIQIRSGYNILNFYFLREKMFRGEGKERLDILDQLTGILREEIKLDRQLLQLCEKDARLGFHSEAEGYKYFPEKIRWRMEQLSHILADDVPEIKKIIPKDQSLFPEYTGQKPEGAIADCIFSDDSVWSDKSFVLPMDLKWQPCSYGSDTSDLQWASVYGKDALYIIISEKQPSNHVSEITPVAGIEVRIEPQRLYPAIHIVFEERYIENDGDPVHIIGYPLIYKAGFSQINDNGLWCSTVRIPFKSIGIDAEHLHPVRTDIKVQTRDGGSLSWRPVNPTTERLILGSDNPADLGWLIFRNKTWQGFIQ